MRVVRNLLSVGERADALATAVSTSDVLRRPAATVRPRSLEPLG